MSTSQAPSDVPQAQDEAPQVVNLVTSRADNIHADLVRLHQSTARRIEAEEIDLHQSATAQAASGQITAHETAIGIAQAGEIHAGSSGIGAMRAEVATVSGNIGTVIAGTANLQDAYAGMVAGRNVQAKRIETLVLLSKQVEGEVHTVVNTRDALLAGTIGGLLAGLAMLLGCFLFRRE
ncbi:MAG: hypothetical protein D6770_00740 [Anaerolineae bacterium]|nr:MAG: hypothetical protein D6770_00740 [Anaerolineae bacterium]